MKKNVMMRVASVMMVLVLMTSSVISGTFAKYVTEGTGKDFARVAKFGVVVTGDSDIFDAEYKGHEGTWTNELTVEADTDINVVAPGTTKTMAKVKITGTPEVAVRISNRVDKFDIGDNWVVDGAFYCPLVFTIYDAKGAATAISGLDYANAAAFEAAVVEKIETATKEYAPLTVLDDLASNQVLNITWNWAFVGSNDSADLTYGQTDAKDTALGNAAAKGKPGTVDISVTTIVTQVD